MLEPFERARQLLGSPFRPQGRSPVTGLDCVGVVILAFALRDVDRPSYRFAGWSWRKIEHEIGTWFTLSSPNSRQRNRLVVFDFGRSFHFGVTGDRSFVHADLRLRRVVEQPFDDLSNARFFDRQPEYN